MTGNVIKAEDMFRKKGLEQYPVPGDAHGFSPGSENVIGIGGIGPASLANPKMRRTSYLWSMNDKLTRLKNSASELYASMGITGSEGVLSAAQSVTDDSIADHARRTVSLTRAEIKAAKNVLLGTAGIKYVSEEKIKEIVGGDHRRYFGVKKDGQCYVNMDAGSYAIPVSIHEMYEDEGRDESEAGNEHVEIELKTIRALDVLRSESRNWRVRQAAEIGYHAMFDMLREGVSVGDQLSTAVKLAPYSRAA